MEKLNPGGSTLVFSPMSTKKRGFFQEGKHDGTGASARSGGADVLSVHDSRVDAGAVPARMISTPPSA